MMRAMACCTLVAVTAACAHIDVTQQLRVEPLEEPRRVVVEIGKGLKVSGRREGMAVRAEVSEVLRCADELHQRARGWQVTIRTPHGASLALEWLFGGAFALSGGAMLGYALANPPPSPTLLDGELQYESKWPPRITGGALLAFGLGLLGGAAWQQATLGRSERDLGERVMMKRVRDKLCGEQPAPNAVVRLTLSDGQQLEATADAAGVALVPLPGDVTAILEREGRSKATLEATGDVRAQVRVQL
jgi:hypothetical protein